MSNSMERFSNDVDGFFKKVRAALDLQPVLVTVYAIILAPVEDAEGSNSAKVRKAWPDHHHEWTVLYVDSDSATLHLGALA